MLILEIRGDRKYIRTQLQHLANKNSLIFQTFIYIHKQDEFQNFLKMFILRRSSFLPTLGRSINYEKQSTYSSKTKS